MRRLLLGMILAAGAGGCYKRDAAAGPDPGAAYTLKHRDKQTGDVFDVVDIGHVGLAGDSGDSWMSDELADQVAYTEWVQDMPPGGGPAAKVRRAYTIARAQPDGSRQGEPRVYQNRTVLIERTPAGPYAIRLDGGRSLTKKEAGWIRNEFEEHRPVPLSKWLPAAPVKLNEPWTLEPEVAVWNEFVRNTTLNKFKVQDLSLKLTKVYDQDGKPYGTIEVTYQLKVLAKTSYALSGTIGVAQTIDLPIDGSSSDYASRIKLEVNASSFRSMDGSRVRVKAVYTGEYKLRTVGAGVAVANNSGIALPDPPVQAGPDKKRRKAHWD